MPHVLNPLKINAKVDSVICMSSRNRKYNNTIPRNERFAWKQYPRLKYYGVDC